MVRLLSDIGMHHRETDGENQDVVSQKEDKRYSVISLADGVSACSRAKTGATIASGSIANLLFKNASFFLAFDEKQIAEYALSHILSELTQQAENDLTDLCEYSSTVASVLYDRVTRKLLFFNLGDSIIIAVENGMCKIVSMPSNSMNGCCVTTTDGAIESIHTGVIEAVSFDSIIICSDGAWCHMFEKNKLKPAVAAMLCGKTFNELADYLNAQCCYDDYSFISLDTIQKGRRKSA